MFVSDGRHDMTMVETTATCGLRHQRKLVSLVNNVLTIKYTRVIINYLKDSDNNDAEMTNHSSTYRAAYAENERYTHTLRRYSFVDLFCVLVFLFIYFLLVPSSTIRFFFYVNEVFHFWWLELCSSSILGKNTSISCT